MTCQDIHGYLERRLRADSPSQTAEFAEHVASCAGCGQLIRNEELLNKHLDLVRGSVPAISASLDNAVMAKYRQQMAKSTAPDFRHWRLDLRTALAWTAALAFAAVVAYATITLFVPHEPARWTVRSDAVPAARVPTPITPSKRAPAVRKVRRQSIQPAQGSIGAKTNLDAATAPANFAPRAFQSLVYCDQISCPGTIEMIRVQIPSPVLGIEQTPAPGSGMVSADVLVGTDGIARGIRVVE